MCSNKQSVMSKKLIQQLKQLKNLDLAGTPKDSWIASNREVLMNQIKPQATSKVSKKSFLGDNFYYVRFFSEFFGSRVLRPVGVFCMVVFAFLGYNAVATMATASIPGDALYSVKTAGENMQLSLTFSDDKKVELQLNFLTRRTDELQKIVKQADNSTSKKAKIAQAVKKITSDVNTVKASMAKISMASISPSAVAVDKKVYDTTIKLGESLTAVHEGLSPDMKQDVAQDMRTALATTDSAGTQMLTMIVKTTEVKGTAVDSNSDVAKMISERIVALEADIKETTEKLNSVATSTPDTTTSTVDALKPSEITDMKDRLKKAQTALDEAKILLDKKQFDEALKKIQECKDIMNGVINQTPVDNDIDVGTSTSSTVSVVSSSTPTNYK